MSAFEIIIGISMLGLSITLIWASIYVLILDRRIANVAQELAQRTDSGVLYAADRRCHVCRCTEDVVIMAGCWWAEDDLCSSCADDAACSLSRGEKS